MAAREIQDLVLSAPDVVGQDVQLAEKTLEMIQGCQSMLLSNAKGEAAGAEPDEQSLCAIFCASVCWRTRVSVAHSSRVWNRALEGVEFSSADSGKWLSVYGVQCQRLEVLVFIAECQLKMILINLIGVFAAKGREGEVRGLLQPLVGSTTGSAAEEFESVCSVALSEWRPARLRAHFKELTYCADASAPARWAQTAWCVVYGEEVVHRGMFEASESNLFRDGRPSQGLLEAFQRATLLFTARNELIQFLERLPVRAEDTSLETQCTGDHVLEWAQAYCKRQFGDDAMRDAREWSLACRLWSHEPHSSTQGDGTSTQNTRLPGSSVMGNHRPDEMEEEFKLCGVSIRRSVENNEDSETFLDSLVYLFAYVLRQNDEFDFCDGFFADERQPMHTICMIRRYKESLLRTPPPFLIRRAGGFTILIKQGARLHRIPGVHAVPKGIEMWSRHILRHQKGVLAWGRDASVTLTGFAHPAPGDSWDPPPTELTDAVIATIPIDEISEPGS